MKLSKSKIIGLVALLAVVGVVCGTLVWRQSQPAPAEPTEQVSITGYLGGEKIGLFDDAKFKALAAKQGIAIDYRKAGSLAMMDADRKGMGYLFPSSRAAVEYGNAKGVKAPPKRHRLQLTDCAIHAQGRGGRARERRTCDQGRFWRVPHGYGQSRGRDGRQHNMADVGYTAGYGQFRIDSTDPVKSNSGNEYAALLATVLNGGQPAMVDSVARDGKTIASIFAKSGWMETSSEDSFNQFLTLGVGSKPMMVGYESQLLDLAVNQPDAFKQIKDDVVIVYPTPTVWSTHTLMALDEKGGTLLNLLKHRRCRSWRGSATASARPTSPAPIRSADSAWPARSTRSRPYPNCPTTMPCNTSSPPSNPRKPNSWPTSPCTTRCTRRTPSNTAS